MTTRNKDTYTKEEVKKLFLAMSKAAGDMAEEEEDLSVEQLREKLEKKRLKEELAKKGSKQTREHDESILGVCKTCHFPIYYGEVIYTPHEILTENEYGGEAGGVYGGGGAFGAYRARSKGKRRDEGWIQCGFCYQIYEKDLEKYDKWENRKKFAFPFVMTLTGLIGLGAGYIMDKEKFNSNFAFWFVGGGLVGFFIAYPVYLLFYGLKPEVDRYKLRIKERKDYELGRTEKKVKVKQYEGEVSF